MGFDSNNQHDDDTLVSIDRDTLEFFSQGLGSKPWVLFCGGP